MSLKRNVVSFFKREFFNFDNPDMNLHDFHPQLRVLLALNGIFFNNQNSMLRFLVPAVSTGLSIVAITLELIFIYHGIDVEDYAFATECFSYTIILGIIPFVYQSILANREKIFGLLDYMNNDFVHVCSLGFKYRQPFLNGQLVIWQLFHAWFAFCGFVVTLFVSNSLIFLFYQNTLATINEHTVRPLIFPAWLPKDDPYKTPNYELLMFLEIFMMISIIVNFVVYVYTIFHYLLHCYYMTDMIMIDLECLFDGIDEGVGKLPKENPIRVHAQQILNSRMKRIVTWHNGILRTVDTVSSIYGPPLAYQMSLSSMVICLIAYQVAAQLEDGKLNILFTVLCIAACVQLWIPCYLGTLLMDKALSISDACWNSAWYSSPLGGMLRQDLMIVILRAHRPLNIRFVGLPMLTLETYASIISTSYSYLNMLRQSTKN